MPAARSSPDTDRPAYSNRRIMRRRALSGLARRAALARRRAEKGVGPTATRRLGSLVYEPAAPAATVCAAGALFPRPCWRPPRETDYMGPHDLAGGRMILPLQILYFEDLSVGMTETLSKKISSADVVGFAQLTGDRNP